MNTNEEKKKPGKRKQVLAALAAALLQLQNAGAGAYEPVPPELDAAFRAINPLIGDIQVLGKVETQNGTIYILWGPLDAPDADSSFTEQAAFRVTEGKVERINGPKPPIPAEEYLQDEKTAQNLNDDFVNRRTEMLGGKEKTEQFLEGRVFMSVDEAAAWTRAGIKINPETKLYRGELKPPFQRAGDLLQETPETQPQEIREDAPAPASAPSAPAPEVQEARSMEW